MAGRLAPLWRSLSLSALPAAVVLLVTALAVLAIGRDLADAVVDPAALTGRSPYLGGLSQIGVMGWVAAATAGLLAGADDARPLEQRTWMRRAGLMSLACAVDDLFMLHDQLDELLPDTVPGDIVLVAAAVGAMVLLAPGRLWLLSRSDVLVLAAVALLFGGSLALDAGEHVLARAVPEAKGVVLYAEESLKFCGIAVWLAYVVRLARWPRDTVLTPGGRGQCVPRS